MFFRPSKNKESGKALGAQTCDEEGQSHLEPPRLSRAFLESPGTISPNDRQRRRALCSSDASAPLSSTLEIRADPWWLSGDRCQWPGAGPCVRATADRYRFDKRLTDAEAEKIARLIVRLPELVELEQDRNKAKSRRRSPTLQRPVTLGDLSRDGELLEVECSACRPSRLLYIEPLSLGLPKRLPVPDVANHLVAASVVPRMTS
jgi:hypothetical protein